MTPALAATTQDALVCFQSGDRICSCPSRDVQATPGYTPAAHRSRTTPAGAAKSMRLNVVTVAGREGAACGLCGDPTAFVRRLVGYLDAGDFKAYGKAFAPRAIRQRNEDAGLRVYEGRREIAAFSAQFAALGIATQAENFTGVYLAAEEGTYIAARARCCRVRHSACAAHCGALVGMSRNCEAHQRQPTRLQVQKRISCWGLAPGSHACYAS